MIPWLEDLKALVRALDGTAVTELEVRQGAARVLIRRLGSAAPLGPRPAATAAVASAPPAATDTSILRTPLAGIFYTAPSPDDPVYVDVGDLVEAGQIVGLIEAMKVFNEIHAEQPGRLVRLLATNGQSVAAGDPLLEFAPVAE